MNIIAVMPVKGFADAKQRLSPALAPAERAAVARAMAEDTLGVLCRCPEIRETWVVTDDPAMGAIAQTAGARWLPEHSLPQRGGLNQVAESAAGLLPADSALLLVHSDLPLLTDEELSTLVGRWASLPGPARVALVPSADRDGTNLLLAQPPQAVRFAYGPGSCARHVAACEQAGLPLAVVPLTGAGRDVDNPEDLDAVRAAFEQGQPVNRTGRLLACDRPVSV